MWSALDFSAAGVRGGAPEGQALLQALFFQPPSTRKAAVGQKWAVQGTAGLKWGEGTQAAPPT